MLDSGNNGEQRIDDGVARHHDVVFVDPFPQEVLTGNGSGGEVEVGEHSCHRPIDFLGKRRPFVVGTKTCLHMAHLDPAIERGEGCGHGGGGVTVHQNHVGSHFFQHRFQFLKHLARNFEKILAGVHDIEVIIGPHVKKIQHLVEHFPVLSR